MSYAQDFRPLQDNAGSDVNGSETTQSMTVIPPAIVEGNWYKNIKKETVSRGANQTHYELGNQEGFPTLTDKPS